MTLEETVLQKLAEWQPQGSGRQTLAISHEPTNWSVRLVADRYDELSCALWEMGEQSLIPLVARGVTLNAWADKIAAESRGLLEPLCVIEIDAERNEALLRSTEPAVRKQDRFYYEALLTGGGQATVRRYKGTPTGRRQQVPFSLTHETLARLASDLAI